VAITKGFIRSIKIYKNTMWYATQVVSVAESPVIGRVFAIRYSDTDGYSREIDPKREANYDGTKPNGISTRTELSGLRTCAPFYSNATRLLGA